MLKFVSEIGVNHLGSEEIATRYCDFLASTQTDAITMQIRESDFYDGSTSWKNELSKEWYVKCAEIVRGSIQSLPRGQVEAAISLGLSPYQRLNLIILPQALRSMIPSLTNQYLNCWKNSSLAFVIGFSDFYAVFNTIWNNAGHAVVVMFMVLATYQVGSLIISAIMNYINSNVTKVKI